MDKISEEKIAAIALALKDFESENAHDMESYVITIQRPAYSGWTQKNLLMRKLPVRK